jgi:hypothetical protein
MPPLRFLTLLGALVSALALAAPALAGGPALALGVAEDSVKAPDLVGARAQLALLQLAGFSSVRITSQWLPGTTAPTEGELGVLRALEGAARLTGVRVFVSVYHPGSRTTPLTPEAQDQFASYVASLVSNLPSFDDVIVGNEPNLNRFWLPQFAADGSVASAPAYLALLAKAYDAAKAADPAVRVWGGATSPRGSDRPEGTRPTTSPTVFVRALGIAYRASGRTLPVMDGYAHHPYPDTSAQSPDVAHPSTTTIALADYDKLVGLLGEAFDGTAQPGSTLPILYAEFGVESAIPDGKASAYTGSEPATTKPVDERTQASSYSLALSLAFCQPNVAGLLLFHSVDESERAAWQSGVYYADRTPKSSLYAVRDALRRVRGGSIARCPDLALPIAFSGVRFPTPRTFLAGDRAVRFRCSLDCRWQLRAIDAVTGVSRARVRGFARAGNGVVASLQGRKLGRAPVRLELTAVQPVNPGEPTVRQSIELKPF